MIDFLLYANMSCTDAAEVIGRVKAHEDMSKNIKTEIVETLKDATPHCQWDAND